jgi:transposase
VNAIRGRAQFVVARADIDPAQVVVIDEFGSNLNMTPRYARAPRGERATAAVPRNTPQNTTTISSLTLHGIGPRMLIAGSVTTAVFEAYVEHVLAPSLRPGKIVVLDNLSAHTSPRIRTLVATCDCQLWYLPPYSPDYSPIELAFAKIKAEVRRMCARTREVLEDAIARALTHISADDAHAFFRHCGFALLQTWLNGSALSYSRLNSEMNTTNSRKSPPWYSSHLLTPAWARICRRRRSLLSACMASGICSLSVASSQVWARLLHGCFCMHNTPVLPLGVTTSLNI